MSIFDFLVPPVRAQDAETCVNAGELGSGGINLGDVLCLSNNTPVNAVYTSPAFLVNLIVRNVFVIGGIILFLLIFYAGFKFVQSGTQGKEEARKILTTAITGAVVMFCAYWIVQIVQLLTGVDVAL